LPSKASCKRLKRPAGKHDDQVDAFGLIGQVLDKMTADNAPSKPPVQLLGANEMTMNEALGVGRAEASGPVRTDLTPRNFTSENYDYRK
jgi:hypothetical protein